MKTSTVRFIEVVSDPELRKLEKKAAEAVRRIYPGAPAVRLYRTADGKIGCQMQVSVAPGERKRLDQAYRAVRKALGERRGRRPGVKTVQTKLRLPQPLFVALKKAAEDSGVTMSAVVSDSLTRTLQSHRRSA